MHYYVLIGLLCAGSIVLALISWGPTESECGDDCPLYYCPTSREVECPNHGGFDVCCAWPEFHRPVEAGDR